MGINTLAYLPSTTDLGDLTLAIQKLTDADSVKLEVNPWNDRPFAEAVRGNDVVFDSIFEVTLVREAGFGDKDRDGNVITNHRGSIHLAASHNGKVSTLLYCGTANAFWAALSDGLVDFFGGTVDYNDCDLEDANTTKRPTRYSKVTNGDAAWTAKQQGLRYLKCVTDYKSLAKYDKVVGIYSRNANYNQEPKKVSA